MYFERGFFQNTPVTSPIDTTPTNEKGLRISEDSIIHVSSGITSPTGEMVLGYLHKAIRPLNQLRMLEDAVVIYRIVRAPERRIFYIDIGNLPKMKAEQYMRDIMVKHKNKLVYNSQTGEIRDDRRFLTMMEDFWFPKRNGEGTEVTTLPSGQSLGQIDDILYFRKKLYESLNIPFSRTEPENQGINFGDSAQITRDELVFSRFIARLRRKFSEIFYSSLINSSITTLT